MPEIGRSWWILLGTLAAVCVGASTFANPSSRDDKKGGDSETIIIVPPWALVADVQLAAAQELGVPVAFENDLGMRFVLIPKGGGRREGPPFYMQVAETTVTQFERWEGRRPYPRNVFSLTVKKRPAEYELGPGGKPVLVKPELKSHEWVASRRGHWVPAHNPAKHEKGMLIRKKPTWTLVDGEQLPSKHYDRATHPLGLTSPSEVRRFVAWLNERDPSRRYRIPTEDEWEHACRAGTRGKWYWGNEESSAAVFETFGRTTPGSYSLQQMPSPVAGLRPNPWGLYDMLGNVAEYCVPVPALSKNAMVVRGSSHAGGLEPTEKRFMPPAELREDEGIEAVGLRLAADP